MLFARKAVTLAGRKNQAPNTEMIGLLEGFEFYNLYEYVGGLEFIVDEWVTNLVRSLSTTFRIKL